MMWLKTKVNTLRCTRSWLWLESVVGRELLPNFTKSKMERVIDGPGSELPADAVAVTCRHCGNLIRRTDAGWTHGLQRGRGWQGVRCPRRLTGAEPEHNDGPGSKI